jgi:ZIP family zinc transporter
LLDGIPESAAIGISLIEGGGVGIALVAAVFLSNIPEGLSSAAGAILTMLASTMMPEAYEDGGPVVGIVTTAGFLLAFVLGRLA